jgi:uncharacterized protein
LSTHVIVFCKPPVFGKVKTRLATSIGDEKALRVYIALTEAVFQHITEYPVSAYVSNAEGQQSVTEWLGCSVTPQRGESLGDRLINAIQDEFDAGYSHVVVIGSDTIYLDDTHVRSAVEGLVKAPVSFGPTSDGGFYLIGVSNSLGSSMGQSPRQILQQLFSTVKWSSESVMQTILNNASRMNIQIQLGKHLNDIDTIEDLDYVLKNVPDKFSKLARQLESIVR